MRRRALKDSLDRLREVEQRLDSTASSLDRSTDIRFRDVVRILVRVGSYFKLFKARIFAKISFITLESLFRLLIVPWPGKVVVDHVILGKPISDDASGFPFYFAPFVLLLQGKSAVEMMLWIMGVGVLMVLIFGVTPNRGAGRSPSGAPTGTAAGASGAASAELAQGHDTATQTENEANRAGSLMGGLLGILDFKINLRLSQSLNHVLRTSLAARILALPMVTLDDQRIGDTVYRILYDTTSATLLLEAITVGMYSGVLGVVVSLIMMNIYYGNAPEVIVLAILTFPLMLVAVVPFARVARRRSQASRASGANTTSNIEEGMSNVLAVQSLGGNERESKRFERISLESFKRFRLEAIVKLSFQQVGSLAFMLGQVVFFIVMARQVIEGTFTAGDYFVVVYYFFVLSATFSAWGYMYTEWQVYVAGLRRVFFLMDLPVEREHGSDIPPIKSGVVMNQVSLIYPDGRQALRNVDFEASIGEIVALVGPTGAGKSSLAYLIPSFVQASAGTVAIDGIDLKDVAVQSLRDQISYVFQETHLFSESIRDNIRSSNRAASNSDIEHVARIAGAHDFIAALPDGYDTNLGTVTSKLSAGQQQRISIARGLLKDARILILDEPTSALDPETESHLVDALYEAAKEKLVILIAHRLSTISHADRIYFLTNGEIVESGSHQELMSLPEGKYREFVNLQAGTD